MAKKPTTNETDNGPLDEDQTADQAKLVAEATGADGDINKVIEGEYAVKLKYDIQGGLGNHQGGTILRRLSHSAFIGLTQAGGHEALDAGASLSDDAVDVSRPLGG